MKTKITDNWEVELTNDRGDTLTLKGEWYADFFKEYDNKQLALCNVSCSRRVSNENLINKTYESLNKVKHGNEDARQGYFRGYKNGAIWMRKQYEK